MTKLLSLLAAFTLLASGAFAQDAKEDPLEKVVRLTGNVNPYLQAIYREHMDVAREVFAGASQRNWAAEKVVLAAVITAYGAPALARAGDNSVISVMNAQAELAGIVAKNYPEGCEYFFTGDMRDAYSNPEVRNGRMADLRAKAYAYQDGKFRAPVTLMSAEKLYQIMTQYLGMTPEDVRKASAAPNGVSDEDMCSIARKLNNVGALPKELQGDWGRALLARDPSAQKESKKPAADAKTASGAVVKTDSFEREMQVLAGINPLMHAIFRDHEDEARQMISAAEAGKVDVRKGSADLMEKYGNPALAGASDAAAIDVSIKTLEFTDVLTRYFPQGCRDFLYQRLSPGALDVPEVSKSYWNLMEAKRVAYVDGKPRQPGLRYAPQDMLPMITRYLGVSADDIRNLVTPGKLTDQQACVIMKKLNAIEPVPEAQRGAWARTSMSSGG